MCAEGIPSSLSVMRLRQASAPGSTRSAKMPVRVVPNECFGEIDNNIRYDFVARTGEAYNIIWQINTTALREAKNDENAKFYTMVKRW